MKTVCSKHYQAYDVGAGCPYCPTLAVPVAAEPKEDKGYTLRFAGGQPIVPPAIAYRVQMAFVFYPTPGVVTGHSVRVLAPDTVSIDIAPWLPGLHSASQGYSTAPSGKARVTLDPFPPMDVALPDILPGKSACIHFTLDPSGRIVSTLAFIH